jgi:hypothetical protein
MSNASATYLRYPFGGASKHRVPWWELLPVGQARSRSFADPRSGNVKGENREEGEPMAKDHGPSVKDDKQYEGLRKKGMSKQRAASIANSPGASKRGGKKSGKGSGGSRSQKRAAGRERGRKSGKSS